MVWSRCARSPSTSLGTSTPAAARVHFGSTLYANCASVKNARRETGAPIVARAAVIDFDVASRRASVVELASYT